MPNTPLIIRAQSAIQGLVLLVDGYPDHQHRLATRIGGEPLEDGRDVTDHVVAAPESVTLTGIVSDFGGSQRPVAAWQEIERLHKASESLVLVTEWGIYNEMVIQRCDARPVGRSLEFTMELREILRVSTSTQPSVPPTAMRGLASGRSGTVARGRVGLYTFFGSAFL